jgi:hypothetical protein
MAGDTIIMPENAFLMIHDPSGLVMGTAEDMRSTAEALDKVKGCLIQGYAAKSGKPDEDIATLMAAETWLDAKDAQDLGFIDRIAEPVKLAASFDMARFRNAPPELVEAVTETVGALNSFEDDPDQAVEATPPAVPESDVGKDSITPADTATPAEDPSAPIGQVPGVSIVNTRPSIPSESSVVVDNTAPEASAIRPAAPHARPCRPLRGLCFARGTTSAPHRIFVPNRQVHGGAGGGSRAPRPRRSASTPALTR